MDTPAKFVFDTTKGYSTYIEYNKDRKYIHVEFKYDEKCEAILASLAQYFGTSSIIGGGPGYGWIQCYTGGEHKIKDGYEFIADIRKLQKLYGRLDEPPGEVHLSA